MGAILCVGAGGCLGAIGRYLIGLAPFDGSFPLTTFFVNFMGAVAIGALTEASLGTAGMPREAELFFKTGLCGGFTTFSTFSLETFELFESGDFVTGSLYAGGSLVACVLGVALGKIAVRGVLSPSSC